MNTNRKQIYGSHISTTGRPTGTYRTGRTSYRMVILSMHFILYKHFSDFVFGKLWIHISDILICARTISGISAADRLYNINEVGSC